MVEDQQAAGEREDEPLAAGAFGAWLDEMDAALRGEGAADVPCGSCTACCTASQFVHIEPDELDTLAHVPAQLLFPAPRQPRGHVLLGYDERGRCPMLVDGSCSIYEHRPRTCRTYDCRVFAAADLEPDPSQPEIAARARRWRFEHPTEEDDVLHAAVRAAAAYVRDRPDLLAPEEAPRAATGQAVLAVRLRGAFLDRRSTGLELLPDPDPREVRAALHPGPARR